jgi:L-lactate dehydrogenase complex protein LldF
MAAYELFLKNADDFLYSGNHKSHIQSCNEHLENTSELIKDYYLNYELVRSRAYVYRNRVLDNLDKLLLDFESSFSRNGGKVVWANNAREAQSELVKIVEKHKANYVFLGQSEIAKELHLEVGLNKEKITIFGQEPYQVVISQATFFCVESGLVGKTSPDAREQRIFNQAKVKILFVGIESLVQSIQELDFFTRLQSINKTGELLPEYLDFLTGGASKPDEETYLFLVDNGRTNVLKDKQQSQALTCIQCNACMYACNVYKHAGNKTYDSIYKGPIGSIISAKYFSHEDFSHLYFASLLDGKPEQFCPVKIDFTKILLHNRKQFVKDGLSSKKDNISLYFWKNAMLKRSSMEKGGGTLKNFMLRQFFRKSWGDKREFPAIADKSFNQLWRERKGIK